MRGFNHKWYKFDKYEWITINGERCLRPAEGAKFQEYNPFIENEKLLKDDVSKSNLYSDLLNIDVEQRIFKRWIDTKINEKGERLLDENTIRKKKQEFDRSMTNLEGQIEDFVNRFGLLGYVHQFANFIIGKPQFLPYLVNKIHIREIQKLKKDKKQLNKNIFTRFDEYEDTKDYLKFDYKYSINNSLYFREYEHHRFFKNNGKCPKGYCVKGIWPYQHVAKFVRGTWSYYWVRCDVVTKSLSEGGLYKDYKPYDFISDEHFEMGNIIGVLWPGIYSEDSPYRYVFLSESNKEWQNQSINDLQDATRNNHSLALQTQNKRIPTQMEETYFPIKKVNNNFESLYSEDFLRNYSEPISFYIKFISSLRDACYIENYKEKRYQNLYNKYKDEDISEIDISTNKNLHHNNLSSIDYFLEFRDSVDKKTFNHNLNLMLARNLNITDFASENKIVTQSVSLIGYIGQMIVQNNQKGKKTKMCQNPGCKLSFSGNSKKKYCDEICRIKHRNDKKYARLDELNNLINSKKKKKAKTLLESMFQNKNGVEYKKYKELLDKI